MEDERQRQDKYSKELILIAQKAAKYYKQYIKSDKYVTVEMLSLTNNQQYFYGFITTTPTLSQSYTNTV